MRGALYTVAGVRAELILRLRARAASLRAARCYFSAGRFALEARWVVHDFFGDAGSEVGPDRSSFLEGKYVSFDVLL